MVHTLLMNAQTLLHIDDIFSLELLHFSLAELYIRHDDGGVLQASNLLFEVHLNLV
jgi:hypothetical protein